MQTAALRIIAENDFPLHLRLERGFSDNTVRAYQSDVFAFLESGCTNIHSFLTRQEAEKLSARSVARKLAALKSFFRFAEKQGACGHIEIPEPPKYAQKLPTTLSPEQALKLLETAAEKLEHFPVRVLYSTGIRVSELAGLKLDDADLQTGLLKVRGKGGKNRVVPLDPESTAILSRYLSEVREPRAKAAPPELFLSRLGKGYTRQSLWKMVREVSLRAGIEGDVSPHVFRHAFATHLLENGMNLRSLQQLLGHADVSTTQTYLHVTQSHLHEAVAKHPRAKKR